MRNSEFYYAFRFLEERNIKVFPVPINNSGSMKICISRSGREKLGHEVYKTYETSRLETIESNGCVRKIKVTIPPVHVKIEEIVIDIFRKNGGKNTPGYLFNNLSLIKSLYNSTEQEYTVQDIRKGLFFIANTSLEFFEITRQFSDKLKKITIEIYDKIYEKESFQNSKIAS